MHALAPAAGTLQSKMPDTGKDAREAGDNMSQWWQDRIERLEAEVRWLKSIVLGQDYAPRDGKTAPPYGLLTILLPVVGTIVAAVLAKV